MAIRKGSRVRLSGNLVSPFTLDKIGVERVGTVIGDDGPESYFDWVVEFDDPDIGRLYAFYEESLQEVNR